MVSTVVSQTDCILKTNAAGLPMVCYCGLQYSWNLPHSTTLFETLGPTKSILGPTRWSIFWGDHDNKQKCCLVKLFGPVRPIFPFPFPHPLLSWDRVRVIQVLTIMPSWSQREEEEQRKGQGKERGREKERKEKEKRGQERGKDTVAAASLAYIASLLHCFMVLSLLPPSTAS